MEYAVKFQHIFHTVSVQVQTESKRTVQYLAPHPTVIPRQRVVLDDQMERTSKLVIQILLFTN